MYKSGVLLFPGSNCSQDAFQALDLLGMNPEYIWHKEQKIDSDFNFIIIPGGFSYGDYIRSGVVAVHSPIITALRNFIDQGGLVLGICNGFHILTEMGVLRGALVRNKTDRFICRYEQVEVVNSQHQWSRAFPRNNIILPIAHGDGSFFCGAEDLDYLERNNLIIFRYKNNPNGSVSNIAGIVNEDGNVLGMMPHPERVVDCLISSVVDGKYLFESIKTSLS